MYISMNEKVQYKNKAIELRQNGNTYDEILRLVPVSRGTLSAWLREVELSHEIKKQLSRQRRDKIRAIRGRELTVRKASAVVRRGFAERDARRDYAWHAKKPLFEIGLGLLLAGGRVGKASASYMTGDEAAMKLMVRWANRFLDLPPGKIGMRLYLPRSADLGTARIAWTKATGLPAAAFKKPAIVPEPKRKPRNMAGIARLELGGAGTATRIRIWREELVVRYGE